MSAQDTQLKGKTAFVTGGARGLGRCICEALSRAGASVVIADMRSELAEQACREIMDAGGLAMHVQLDVRDPAQIANSIAAAQDRFGRIDILINNAAVDFTVSVGELSVDQWNMVIETNLSGPFLLAKQVVEQMKARGDGHIVNIASTASKRAWPNASAYHASKWGLLGLSHALHSELRPHGVRVTAVVAGGMKTPFLLDRFPDIDPNVLQDPANVARTIVGVLCLPPESVVAEISVLPMGETSWP